MAKKVLLDVRCFVGGVDLSGYSNKLEISDAMEEKAVTNYRSGGAVELIAGLESVEFKGEGQLDTPVDAAFWAARRVVEPYSVAPDATSDIGPGGTVYFTKALRTDSKLFDTVGEVSPWSIESVGSWPLVKGTVAHASGTPRTASGTGTGYQLGPVAEGQRLFAVLHVLSVAGTATPTITARVESDNANTFASATTVATFEAKTAIGGEALKVEGPITDDWYRLAWTVSGTTPSFLLFAAMGIG